MKFMVRHLLFFALFFGTLSFTVVSNPVDTDWEDSTTISCDSIIPVQGFEAHPKAVSHPAFEQKQYKRKVTFSPVREQQVEETALPNSVKAIAICKGEGEFVAGRPRFVSGTFRDTVMNSVGRDSVIITKLSVLNCQSI
ncbi:MAG: hypothetical protein AAF806_27410 [Bacteroidota bacterium]